MGASLAKRAGTLAPVALGLTAVTGGLARYATSSGASGYGHYILAMVIICAGIGLAMSAATSASMRELPPAKAEAQAEGQQPTGTKALAGAARG